jgi:uncharacterized protein
MQLPDANVLIYAFRPGAERHVEYRQWLEQLISGEQRFALSELVLSAVVGIVTDRRLHAEPDPLEDALAYANFLRAQPHGVLVSPGARHWEIFSRLCRETKITGSRVSDAYHAALAIEHGCEWITTDREYARFRGLRWRHPLDR